MIGDSRAVAAAKPAHLGIGGRATTARHRRRRVHRLQLRPPRRSTTPTTHVTVLDTLTYAGQPGVARRPARGPRHASSQGDIARRRRSSTPLVAGHDAVVHFAAESHNDNSLHDPSPVPATPTSSAPSRCSRRSRRHGVALPPHLHRRGVRRPRARRPGAVHRGDAVQPVEPVLLDQGRLRPAGAGLGALVRRAGDDLATARTTTGPYQHVEKFIPRQITNVLDGVRPKLYGAGRERARLDPRRRPHVRRAGRSSSRAGSARPT